MTRKEEEISFHTLHPPYLFWRAGPSEREERKENPADSSGKSGEVGDLERIPLKPSEQECGDGVDVGHVYLSPKAACQVPHKLEHCCRHPLDKHNPEITSMSTNRALVHSHSVLTAMKKNVGWIFKVCCEEEKNWTQKRVNKYTAIYVN